MSSLLRALDTEVGLDYGQFCVEDTRGAAGPAADPAGPGVWLLAGENQLVVESASTRTHSPAVRLEAWDGPPGPAGPGWPDRARARVRFGSAVVLLHALTEEEPDGEPLVLGPPGVYEVDGHRRGGERVEPLVTGRPDASPRGVEQFLLRFWPVS
ncbi:hypothetical protein [Streptomyces sp. NPDC090994]|uniref:hypothetical protein n=1 Tax=Streptomyces sp. NPDC090994 TaxID=3365969 RepID=UPI003804FAC5